MKKIARTAYKQHGMFLQKNEETVQEGRASQRHPLEGHEYHKKSNDALVHIAKDAHAAAEDIRFARTISRIQSIMVSELTKIALVHLYSQGYTDENLTNFELSLTNPSIIFEQEKIALLKEKVELANSMMENKLLPSDFIYEHIFQFSEDKFDEYKDLIMQDAKRKFRLAQIEFSFGLNPNCFQLRSSHFPRLSLPVLI